ncbi:MAG TPA: helix-turn-helix domain-containing protein [Verrucomicrobiae bacterium]|nr:helix-turn-helix domain-containing protein [Verrucomicrobiae bacterium]
MPSTPFGDRLKREREMRGVSLDEVAAATRIAPKFLEALENDQWDQLPGGVFNRGFIRSIARFLGLDEDNLVAEYDLVTRGHAPQGAPPVPPPQFDRNWKPLIVALVILLAFLVGGFFLVAHFGPRVLSHLHHPHRAIFPPASAPAHTAAKDASGDSAHRSALSSADPLELQLDAGKPADVTIFADGKQVFDGHVEPGDSRDFEAHENFRVTSSEASALLLELNGQTIPPMGIPGQPGSVTLTRSDLNNTGGAH